MKSSHVYLGYSADTRAQAGITISTVWRSNQQNEHRKSFGKNWSDS
jgi:hypothetical protein